MAFEANVEHKTINQWKQKSNDFSATYNRRHSRLQKNKC